jgi:hypothetical protein
LRRDVRPLPVPFFHGRTNLTAGAGVNGKANSDDGDQPFVANFSIASTVISLSLKLLGMDGPKYGDVREENRRSSVDWVCRGIVCVCTC